MKTDFPDVNDLLHFSLTISPDEGEPPWHPLDARISDLGRAHRLVQRRRFPFLLRHLTQLPTRSTQGPVQRQDLSSEHQPEWRDLLVITQEQRAVDGGS